MGRHERRHPSERAADASAAVVGTSASVDFERAVVDVVRHIPAGQVMYYGEVAEDAGFPGAARAVGNLMRASAEEMPWWRVVGSGGRITSRSVRQAELLRSEGWSIENGRIGRLR